MRLPGTLKELSKQLAAFPAQITRVTVPTENGPFVLEFGEAKTAAPAIAAAPRARKPAEVQPHRRQEQEDGIEPPKVKVRDTRLLARVPPAFDFTYGGSDAESEAA